MLYSLDSKQPFIFKHRKTNEQAKVYCGINIYGKFFVGNTKDCIITTDKYIPATKEQRDLLFQKMTEAGYIFDFEKKELKKIDDKEVNGEDYGIDGLWHAQRILEKTLGSVEGYQSDDGILEHKEAITAVKKLYRQNTTWSEEDEKTWKELIEEVENKFDYIPAPDCRDEEDERVLKRLNKWLTWLKSLRPQEQWKPSDEMLEALYRAIPENVMEKSEDEMLLDKLYQGLKYGRVLSDK